MAKADVRLIQQLHDGPTQWMAVALLHLDRASSAGGVVDAHLLKDIRTLLGEALRSIRHLLDDWCECVPAMSLAAALMHLGQRLAALTGLMLHLECDERVVDPPLPVRALVVHAAQELLFNTCKHAPGAQASMILAVEGDGFELAVCDDGPGFDPAIICWRHSIVGGRGLGILPERLAEGGVALRVHSRPGEGVQACIRWPADTAGQNDSQHGLTYASAGTVG